VGVYSVKKHFKQKNILQDPQQPTKHWCSPKNEVSNEQFTIFSSWHFPDSCQVPWHFQVFQKSGHPVSVLTLMAASWMRCFSSSASEAFLIRRCDSSSVTLTFSASKSAASSDRTYMPTGFADHWLYTGKHINSVPNSNGTRTRTWFSMTLSNFIPIHVRLLTAYLDWHKRCHHYCESTHNTPFKIVNLHYSLADIHLFSWQ